MSEFSEVVVQGGLGSGTNSPLMQMLMCESLEPGDEPSYQICKTIYVDHVLGSKIAEAPITMAQSQERDITIQGAPDEVKKAFTDEWAALDADTHILNVHALSRVYGIATIVLGVKDYPSDKPVDMEKIYNQEIFFNELDPLNTAGSLVLSQQTNDPNYQKPITVRTSGQTYHPSRFRVVMNERPVFIQYTNSAFGFVGRSVYQRILFPLKSYLRSMIANDIIQAKLVAIIAKQKQPGPIINQAMKKIAAWKRTLMKYLVSGEVLSIDVEEDVTTFDMTNVDGAGTYSRSNILKDIATGANMPAKLVENETLVSGFGEGTEDAKHNALYIDSVRIKMRPEYQWFNNIVQYRAWNPEWYKRVIQAKYPETYGGVDFKVAFSEWRQAFQAEWPSFLTEPESEKIKQDQVKLEAVVAILNILLNQLDPVNKTTLIQWASDCFGENKRLFPHEIELDWEALAEFQQTNQDKQDEAHEAAISPENEGKFQSFADTAQNLAKLKALVDSMQKPAKRKIAA